MFFLFRCKFRPKFRLKLLFADRLLIIYYGVSKFETIKLGERFVKINPSISRGVGNRRTDYKYSNYSICFRRDVFVPFAPPHHLDSRFSCSSILSRTICGSQTLGNHALLDFSIFECGEDYYAGISGCPCFSATLWSWNMRSCRRCFNKFYGQHNIISTVRHYSYSYSYQYRRQSYKCYHYCTSRS